MVRSIITYYLTSECERHECRKDEREREKRERERERERGKEDQYGSSCPRPKIPTNSIL